MNMTEWAENEVRLACARERTASGNTDGWDYGCACYESALKAYKSLAEDDHSGFSWSMTKQILMRLMNSQPLTPIEDTDDVWSDRSGYCPNGGSSYQCKRMSSLFKDVYPDGTVKYHDVGNYYCFDTNDPDGASFTGGVGGMIMKEMFPVTMPYIPSTEKYKVAVSECLFDSTNGDFDTVEVSYIIDPNGKRYDVNRYFKEGRDENGKFKWLEIDKFEYERRYSNRVNNKEEN